MAFTLKDERHVYHWDSGSLNPSTSPADIFHGMNPVLGKTQSTVHPPPGLGDCVTSVVDSCVPTTPCRPHQDSYLGLQSSLITAAWLGMGLEAVSLDDWRTSLDPGTHSSPPSTTRLGPPLGPPPGLSILGPGGRRGFTSPSDLCILDTCFTSPSDCEASDISSGPEQLSDLLSSLQISHSMPLKSGGQEELSASLSLCHLQQDSLLPPLAGQWPRASERLSWGPDSGAAQRPLSIEAEACLHRQCAALSEAPLTWRGTLPPKNYQNQEYSCKVFLGGLPWDITEARLNSTFSVFGHLSVEWPGKDIKAPCCPPRGFVYLMFEQERSVAALLKACCQLHPQEFYFNMTSHKMRIKKVQVIPWVLADSNFSVWPSQRLAPSRTVFVGGLHGMMNAQALGLIMNDLFGGVTYVGIDTDRHKYPIGSGRVSFSSHSSYLKSLHAAFVEIKTPKFTKKVQIDPYVEDSLCQRCGQQPGLLFCRDMTCFRYYCNTCWHWKHSVDPLCCHRPIMKNQRSRHSI